jgi:hypothetical protein
MSLFTITFDDSSGSDPPAPPAPSPPPQTPVFAVPEATSESWEYSSYSDNVIPAVGATPPPPAPPTSHVTAAPADLEEDIDEQVRILRRDIPSSPSLHLIASKLFRDQKRGLGKHAKFVLMRADRALVCTKIKDKKFIPIGIGAAFHYRTTPIVAGLKCYDKAKGFLLTESDGTELLRLTFGIQGESGKRGPRTVCLTFLKPIDGIPIELRSRLARKSRNGGWILDLIGKYAQASVKNCVIVSESNHVFLVTRKTATNAVMVDSHPAIPDLHVFAFALSQFLAHV